MSERYTIEHLVEICGGDRRLVEELFEVEILDRDAEVTQRDLERVRVAWSLVTELEVNMAGVDIILRMREEVMQLKQQLADVAHELESHRKP